MTAQSFACFLLLLPVSAEKASKRNQSEDRTCEINFELCAWLVAETPLGAACHCYRYLADVS